MSFFAVTIEEIESLNSIDNADNILRCRLKNIDFEFVVVKNRFSVNEKVIYFPIDSVLPNSVIDRLGLTGRLSGENLDRIKTVCLRGVFSQGIVAKVSDFPEINTSFDIASQLGVVKYDPQPFTSFGYEIVDFSGGITSYDIESSDRFPDITSFLFDKEVEITEKLEGENASVFISNGDIYVCQRNYKILSKDHPLWTLLAKNKIIDFAKFLNSKFKGDVRILGEFIGPGIMGNWYKIKEKEFKIFDIRINNYYSTPKDRLELMNTFGLGKDLHVPIVAQDVVLSSWLNGKSIKEASNGESLLVKRLREGIVIKPSIEHRMDKIGRVVIKQRSPKYLSKSDL